MANGTPISDSKIPKSRKAHVPVEEDEGQGLEEGRKPASGPAKDTAPQQSRDALRKNH